MLRLYGSAFALVLLTLPAGAQVQSQAGGKITVPSAQNSGAGIPGERGSKAGPAPKAQETSGKNVDTNSGKTAHPVREQDAAKVPGKAGGKSGPAVMPPSAHTNKQQ